ncbi:response regulator [Pseudonocardia acidicola]|uniref:Response regulator transcription factor n=1 Tax=Pseudonocardia acidicola TaxID=2724939 RepID=A0ABX1S4H2_9PSEU|nr:response regulator transcription factor [Pseudonocardia acidicola]
MIRVLLVDDHAAVRHGLAAVLADAPDLDVVGACEDGSDVREAAVRLQPDVVLMDLSMVVMGGIEATQELQKVLPSARVVMLTSSIAGAAVHESHAAGAVGFVLKPGSPDEIADAIRAVAAGGTAWCAEAVEALRHGCTGAV